MSAPQEDVTNRWVKVGSWATGGYIVFLAVLVDQLTLRNLLDLTPDQLLTMNTLGDALAGIFAPLAFLWLFVATMVQSQELALQRRDLAQSRDVFSEQAAEAKKTAEFIGAQTDLLKQEAERRQQETGDLELNARIDAMIAFLAIRVPALRLYLFDGNNQSVNSFKLAGEGREPRRFQDLIVWANNLQRWLVTSNEIIEKGGAKRVGSMTEEDRDQFIGRVLEIMLVEPITPEAKQYVTEASLQDLAQTLRTTPVGP